MRTACSAPPCGDTPTMSARLWSCIGRSSERLFGELRTGNGARAAGALEILGNEAVEDAVHPLLVPPVRLAAHALADVAGQLGVPLRALVEPVDLELEPVEAELEEEVALDLPGGLDADLPPAEVGVHGEPAEARDPAPLVDSLEGHRAGRPPVNLDHQHAARLRLGLGALDLSEQLLARGGPDGGEERRDRLVRDEPEQEVDVVVPRPPD